MLQIENLPLSSIFNFITLGGLVTIVVIAYQFYTYIKKSATKEAELKGLVNQNKEELEEVKLEMKEITTKVATDKDKIFKKIDEIDVKSQNRFNKLTELIIDLFTKK